MQWWPHGHSPRRRRRYVCVNAPGDGALSVSLPTQSEDYLRLNHPSQISSVTSRTWGHKHINTHKQTQMIFSQTVFTYIVFIGESPGWISILLTNSSMFRLKQPFKQDWEFLFGSMKNKTVQDLKKKMKKLKKINIVYVQFMKFM